MKEKIPAIIVVLVIIVTIISLIIVLKSQQEPTDRIVTGTPSKSDDSIYSSDGIKLDSIIAPDEDTMFMTNEPVYPTQLFLTDDSFTAFYHDENGVAQSFPIEKCKSGDERIVFGDYELVIYKDTNDYIYLGEEKPGRGIPKEYAEQLFRCYYCENENEEEYKAYRTNLDNNESTKEISVCLFDKNNEDYTIKRFFIFNDKTYYADSNIGKQIKDNAFYNNREPSYHTVDSISKENVPFTYFIFDNLVDNGGFSQVYALLDGSNPIENQDILNREFTINGDYNLEPYPEDALYNHDLSGDGIIINYYITHNNTPTKLEEGTKFKVIKVLNVSGRAVIEVPDVGRILVGYVAAEHIF